MYLHLIVKCRKIEDTSSHTLRWISKMKIYSCLISFLQSFSNLLSTIPPLFKSLADSRKKSKQAHLNAGLFDLCKFWSLKIENSVPLHFYFFKLVFRWIADQARFSFDFVAKEEREWEKERMVRVTQLNVVR